MKEKNDLFYDQIRETDCKYVTDYGPSAKTRYRLILKLLRSIERPGMNILDCGMGTGSLVKQLVRKGYKISGCDFSEKALELARELLPEKVDIFKADLTRFHSLPLGTYDVIICSEVLEHIKKDKLAINNLFKALKNRGYLIVTVPFLMENWSQGDSYTGHIRRYEPGELEKKIQGAGFEIESSFAWGNFFYAFYYQLIKNISPRRVRSKELSGFKKIISFFLYYLFFLDDVFAAKKGKRLFVLARKEKN